MYRRLGHSVLIPFYLVTTGCAQDAKKPSGAVDAAVPPKLLAPSVKKIWIPASIKNGGLEWEEGHYLYRIDRETTWSR